MKRARVPSASLVAVAFAALLFALPVDGQSLHVGDEVIYSGGPTQPPQSKKVGTNLDVKVRTLEIEYVGGKAGKGGKGAGGAGGAAAPKAGPLVLKPLPGRTFDELVSLLGDTDPNLRGSAVAALAAMPAAPRDQVEASLIPTLWDGDGRVVVAAAAALGRLESKKAVDELVALLNQDDPKLVEAAAGALGAIGDARALTALESLVEAQDPALSPHAAKALDAIRRRAGPTSSGPPPSASPEARPPAPSEGDEGGEAPPEE